MSEQQLSGADQLRATLSKPKIQYDDEPAVETVTETPEAGAEGTTPVAQVPPTEKPAVDEFKQKNQLLEQEIARLRQQQEAIQLEMLRTQNTILESTQKKEEKPELTEEQIAEWMQTEPLKATRYIAEQTAKRVRQETLAELQQQEQVQVAQTEFAQKQQEYARNLQKIQEEAPELKDPEHRLTKILIGLETEMPFLLRIPEGPLKALEIAKARYELEQVKTAKATAPAEEPKQTTAEQAKPATTVRETPRAAAMVGGASRGVPPTTSVKLTAEQELAARRMRLTPEEYTAYLKNTPRAFMQEQAPKRRVSA